MSNRNQLIQLIHVAKRQMQMDDDIYRMILKGKTGKDSCKSMSIKELESIVTELEIKGFKRIVKARKTTNNKRLNAKSGKVKTEADKIVAIWITMAEDGIIKDGSASALDAYVRRMTKRNKNIGVDALAFTTNSQRYTILESLKSWHKRVMIKALKEKGWAVPVSDRTNQPAEYDAIYDTYACLQKSIAEGKCK